MSRLRRQRCPSDHSTRAARSQNLSATVRGMRWQGTDTEGRQVRRHVREHCCSGLLANLGDCQCHVTFLMLRTATGFLIHQALSATTMSQQSSGRRCSPYAFRSIGPKTIPNVALLSSMTKGTRLATCPCIRGHHSNTQPSRRAAIVCAHKPEGSCGPGDPSRYRISRSSRCQRALSSRRLCIQLHTHIYAFRSAIPRIRSLNRHAR